MAIPSALIGYAIGTAQILLLDWVRSRWVHARMLRLLRAELRRVKECDVHFDFEVGKIPTSDQIPRPPYLTSKFIDTVTSADFELTDENRDDNTQQVLIDIADGCDFLAHHHARIDKLIDGPEDSSDGIGRLVTIVELAGEYDRQVDRLMYMTHDALRDLERRFKTIRWFPQIGRVFWSPKARLNPAPLRTNDERVRLFREKYPAKKIGPDGTT